MILLCFTPGQALNLLGCQVEAALWRNAGQTGTWSASVTACTAGVMRDVCDHTMDLGQDT